MTSLREVISIGLSINDANIYWKKGFSKVEKKLIAPKFKKIGDMGEARNKK